MAQLVYPVKSKQCTGAEPRKQAEEVGAEVGLSGFVTTAEHGQHGSTGHEGQDKSLRSGESIVAIIERAKNSDDRKDRSRKTNGMVAGTVDQHIDVIGETGGS